MRQSYCVAGHRFAIEAKEELFTQLINYAPFSTDQSDASHVFIIHMTEDEIPSSAGWEHVYTDVSFGPDDYIMFGKESAGIPEEILVENEETCIRIPMLTSIRSLNLSNSVAIVLYEALRQQEFQTMQLAGELHRLQWKD